MLLKQNHETCQKTRPEVSRVEKKRKKQIAWAVVLVLVVVFACFDMVRLGSVTSGTATFIDGEKDVHDTLSYEELTLVTSAVNHHFLYWDNPSCGFSEEVSVTLTDSNGEMQVFCFAMDTCSKIYWQNKGRYVWVSDKKYREVIDMLRTHGFYFPCV